MKTVTLLLCLFAATCWVRPAQAQTQPVAANTTSAKAAPPALITDKMEQAAPSSDALKVRLETNPVTKRLTVHTDATGPTRVEVNDAEGHPVLTRDLIVGDQVAVLDVSALPAGSYIVHCSSGERRGMRRILLGQ
ncbi:T9SS type A sorting domain-containing protein [Hymenobacter sp. BT491]|uniref:T9SS type A sorting domain-containing protein n=1 Tax=Hymenobacter sp. BT491 TaxID=2766779 RepID=UPI001653B5C7|nr:T9SS type A sorting domain-containing protein [Hymenobacter sp. BT491]MBC6991692.1 T9SS type A sorting domain-containing protein [Hymenobacter sp. BT491]